MPTSRRCAILTAALTAAITAPALAAPVNTLISEPAPNAALDYARRSAISAIDTATLVSLANAPRAATTIELDLLGAPASLTTRRVQHHASGAVSIFADFADNPDASAVITTLDGFVSARLEHPTLGAFTIEPTPMRDDDGAPLHRVNEIDPAGFMPCATNWAPANAGSPDDTAAPPRGVQFVDMMMLYTPAVRNTLGGHTPAIVFCQNAIDLANDAYDLSGITQVQLRMVHVEQVDYVESGNTGTDLTRLRNSGDGNFDHIHTTRNQVGADNVALIVNFANNACGQAASLNPVNANLAFSVSARGCAIGNITFPHEVGHTMGCAHDHQNTGGSFYSYAFGHLFQDGNGINRRTIMGVSSGSRIQRFSNPDVLFVGVPTGVASGSNAADNARAHDNSANDMSTHRDDFGCLPFAIIGQPADEAACVGSAIDLSVQVFAEDIDEVSFQWRKNIIPIPGATSQSLTIPSAALSDAGIYDVLVSSPCTSFNSDIVQVSVDNPTFDTQPQSQTAQPGDDVVFSVVFAIPDTQIFWLKNGQLIITATNTDTLTLNDVTEADEATYTANAVAPCGTIVSNAATLTVGAPAGCNAADLAEPFDTLDFSDVIAFLSGFAAMEPTADLAAPQGVFDFSDVVAFLSAFGAGCP